MASLTAQFSQDRRFPINGDAATNAFRGMTIEVDDHKSLDRIIYNKLVELADRENSTLSLPLKNAGWRLIGLPKEGERPGTHTLKIEVNGEKVAELEMSIKAEVTKTNIGLAGARSSKQAAKALRNNIGRVNGLVLKSGDRQHPNDLLWEFNGEKGSLPLTDHTKGDGGKNEKAALDKLKKVMNENGYE